MPISCATRLPIASYSTADTLRVSGKNMRYLGAFAVWLCVVCMQHAQSNIIWYSPHRSGVPKSASSASSWRLFTLPFLRCPPVSSPPTNPPTSLMTPRALLSIAAYSASVSAV